MKKQEIDRVVTEVAEETEYADIWRYFIEGMDKIQEMAETNGMEYNDITIIFASCIQTSFCNSVNMVREILYRLFCDDEDIPDAGTGTERRE